MQMHGCKARSLYISRRSTGGPIVTCLLIEHGAKIEAKDSIGRPTVQLAPADGRDEVVDLLLVYITKNTLQQVVHTASTLRRWVRFSLSSRPLSSTPFNLRSAPMIS